MGRGHNQEQATAAGLLFGSSVRKGASRERPLTLVSSSYLRNCRLDETNFPRLHDHSILAEGPTLIHLGKSNYKLFIVRSNDKYEGKLYKLMELHPELTTYKFPSESLEETVAKAHHYVQAVLDNPQLNQDFQVEGESFASCQDILAEASAKLSPNS